MRALPNPRDSLTKPLQAMTPAEMLAYRKADHAYRRAIMDARAHPVATRDYLLALAGIHAPPLRLDPVKAAAALEGAGR